MKRSEVIKTMVKTHNLRETRIAAGLTQEQLASKVYVVRQTISNIENGRIMPSLELAKAICDELNCTWDIFFSGQ